MRRRELPGDPLEVLPSARRMPNSRLQNQRRPGEFADADSCEQVPALPGDEDSGDGEFDEQTREATVYFYN